MSGSTEEALRTMGIEEMVRKAQSRADVDIASSVSSTELYELRRAGAPPAVITAVTGLAVKIINALNDQIQK